MIVKNVEVCEFRRDDAADVFNVMVRCETDQGTINLSINLPETRSDPKAAVIEDTVRQLQSMPGYRCGSNMVTLAPGVTIDLPGA